MMEKTAGEKLPDAYTGQDVISTSGWGRHGKEAVTGELRHDPYSLWGMDRLELGTDERH